MAKKQIMGLAAQTQKDIQQLFALIGSERTLLKNSLDEEKHALAEEYTELKKQYNELNEKRESIGKDLCEKYGHVYKYRVVSAKTFASHIGHYTQGEVIKECICCGHVEETSMCPCPKDQSIDSLPEGMADDENAQTLFSIIDELEILSQKFTDIQKRFDCLNRRYYTDICAIYGHNPSDHVKCSCCGRNVNRNFSSFMDYLSKWTNL